jgi:hypothetical protein
MKKLSAGLALSLFLLSCHVTASFSESQTLISSYGEVRYPLPSYIEEHGFVLSSWGIEQYGPDEWLFPYSAPYVRDVIIPRLIDIGVNSVVLYWRCIMETGTSNEILLTHSWATEPDSSIINIVYWLWDAGIRRIELKPTVECLDGTWIGEIAPTDPEAWFASYASFINHYADLAESLKPKITRLTIGHEIQSMLSYETEWRNVIAGARQHTTVPLSWHVHTYAVKNRLINFFDALDVVSINNYYALVTVKDPTVEQIVDGWNGINSGTPYNIVQDIIDWHNAKCPNVDVYFNEVAYGSWDGQGMYNFPEVPPGAVPDVQEQADLLEAWFRVWYNQFEWVKGINYYCYDLRPPEYGGHWGNNDTTLYPNDKLVESVIKDWYSSRM